MRGSGDRPYVFDVLDVLARPDPWSNRAWVAMPVRSPTLVTAATYIAY